MFQQSRDSLVARTLRCGSVAAITPVRIRITEKISRFFLLQTIYVFSIIYSTFITQLIASNIASNRNKSSLIKI